MKDNTSETEKKKKESKNIGFYASIKQDAKTLWSFPLFIYFLIGLVAIVILLYWQLDKSQRGTGALVILGYIGFYVTCGTLLWTRKTERHRFASERRHEFITNKDFMDIQMKIERTDSELLCLTAAFNTDEPYSIEFRSCNPQKRFELFWLHQYFDNYLNWFESLAISWTQGLVADDELDGLWSYYLMRLRNVQLKNKSLKVSTPKTRHFLTKHLKIFVAREYPRASIVNLIKEKLYVNYA